MELQLIKHKDILFRDLLRAISIKSVSWPFPIESQFKWILENVQDEDVHIFLRENEIDIAYMTLSPVVAIVNEVQTPFMGVGCVCTRYHGNGAGKELMTRINQVLLDGNHRGLLFCRKELIKFYTLYGWQLIPEDSVHFNSQHNGVFAMVYNCVSINRIDYSDRLF